MIWLACSSIIAAGLAPFGTVWGIATWMDHKGRRHAECLKSIARLERELFPQWFEEETKAMMVATPWKMLSTTCASSNFVMVQHDPYSMAPGARWEVDRVDNLSLAGQQA